MSAFLSWFQTDTGRRLTKWGVAVVALAVQSNLIPIDTPIPFIGVTLSQILLVFGLSIPSGQMNHGSTASQRLS